MKKIILSVFALASTILSAQEYHWTSYNFTVAGEDVEIVGKLMGDYFSKDGSKAEGVSVFLFENHFNDSTVDFSHSIVFTGSLEAMGTQYSQDPSESWQLFLTKLGRYIKSHSSAAGKSLLSFGEIGTHPVQNVYWLRVDEPSKMANAFKTYNSKFNPDDRRVTLGSFNLGRSPSGETHYVLVGVDDFKTAMSTSKYREKNKTAQAAWKKYWEDAGKVKLIRSTTRLMLGKW